MRYPPPIAALELTAKIAPVAVIEDSGLGIVIEHPGSSTAICQHTRLVHNANRFFTHCQNSSKAHTEPCFSPCRPNEVIDATLKGGHARFINHSCEPNCATEKWLVDGDLRVGIYARAHIPAGVEITYHYQLIWNQGHKVKCVGIIQSCVQPPLQMRCQAGAVPSACYLHDQDILCLHRLLCACMQHSVMWDTVLICMHPDLQVPLWLLQVPWVLGRPFKAGQ